MTSKKSPHCNENELSLPHLRSNIWYKFVIPQYIIEKQICTAIPQNLMYFDGYFGRRCMPQCAGKENTLKAYTFECTINMLVRLFVDIVKVGASAW